MDAINLLKELALIRYPTVIAHTGHLKDVQDLPLSSCKWESLLSPWENRRRWINCSFINKPGCFAPHHKHGKCPISESRRENKNQNGKETIALDLFLKGNKQQKANQRPNSLKIQWLWSQKQQPENAITEYKLKKIPLTTRKRHQKNFTTCLPAYRNIAIFFSPMAFAQLCTCP